MSVIDKELVFNLSLFWHAILKIFPRALVGNLKNIPTVWKLAVVLVWVWL